MKMLQAVLFDLDGTLLQVDTEELMREYLKDIGAAAASVTEPNRFLQALMSSTGAMLADRNPEQTNFDVFWADFRSRLEDCIETLEPLLEDFYETKFPALRRLAVTCENSRKAVQAALNKGLRIAIATNPVFPAAAVQERMAWAGIKDLPWDLITSYEEMHFCKPHLEYYHEIASKLGVKPQECLMVGNDTREDMSAAHIGMRTCLVTDYLISSGNEDFHPEWSGPLSELALWLQEHLNTHPSAY
ncbi:MAG: HAD family hydrolase [Firmicutes bacterium]|nr:HAD family hydrolase [Bacillota bacterium]